MTVLVIAPHPDDESIGCGGTIRRHADRGDRVVVLFLTSGELGLRHLPPEDARRIREDEAARAGEVLGVTRLEFLRLPDWYLGDHIDATAAALRRMLEGTSPGIVYLPHAAEWHPDHRACFAAFASLAPNVSAGATGVRLYEVWTPLQTFHHTEDITTVMRHKVRAIRCHSSQLESFRYDAAMRGLNRYRGVITGAGRYAEVFEALDGIPR